MFIFAAIDSLEHLNHETSFGFSSKF